MGSQSRYGSNRYGMTRVPRAVSSVMVGHMTDRESSSGDPRLLNELHRVKLEVSGTASLYGSDIDDPGTMDWWGRASATVWHDWEEDGTHLANDGVALSRRKVDDGEELTIFEANGLRIDLDNVQGVLDALDALSQDYADFMPAFDGGDAELAPKLLEKLDLSFGSDVVILDRVRLAAAWRGLGGVGRILTARVLRWVSANPRVLLLKPFPIDLERDKLKDDAVFKPALKNVRKVWRSLGFRRFTDDIWYLDPIAGSHERAVARLERGLDLART